MIELITIILVIMTQCRSQDETIWKCCEKGSVLDDWYKCVQSENSEEIFNEQMSGMDETGLLVRTMERPLCSTKKLQEFLVVNINRSEDGFNIQDLDGNQFRSSEYHCVDLVFLDYEPVLAVLTCENSQTGLRKSGFLSKCCPHGKVLDEHQNECEDYEDDGYGFIPPRHVLDPTTYFPTGAFHYRKIDFPFYCKDGSFPEPQVMRSIFTNGSAMILNDDEYREVVPYQCVDRTLHGGDGLSDPIILRCKSSDPDPRADLVVSKCCDEDEVLSVTDSACLKNYYRNVEPRSLFSQGYVGTLESDLRLKTDKEVAFISGRFVQGPACTVARLEEGERHVYLTDNNTIVIKGSGEEEDGVRAYRDYCLDLMEDENFSSWIGVVLCPEDEISANSIPPKYIDLITKNCEINPYLAGVFIILSFISLICLMLTILVYCILPILKTMHGRIIISNCLATIMLTLCFLISMSLGNIGGSIECALLGYLVYYSSLSMFVWMTVMCVDILFTFINPSAALSSFDSIHGKFIVYSAVGWIVPLILTFILLILDLELEETSEYKPNVGTKACFIEDVKHKQELYFHLPVLMLLIANFLMFIMFLYKMHKHKLSTRSARMSRRRSSHFTEQRKIGKKSEAPANDRHKDLWEQFVLFSKMFLVLGIMWVFECIHFYAHAEDCSNHTNIVSETIFRFFDAFNQLRGVFIFIIFVCKKTIVNEVKKHPWYCRKHRETSIRLEPGRRFGGALAASLNTLSDVLSQSSSDLKRKVEGKLGGENRNQGIQTPLEASKVEVEMKTLSKVTEKEETDTKEKEAVEESTEKDGDLEENIISQEKVDLETIEKATDSLDKVRGDRENEKTETTPSSLVEHA